jgi:hypothetical protein
MTLSRQHTTEVIQLQGKKCICMCMCMGPVVSGYARVVQERLLRIFVSCGKVLVTHSGSVWGFYAEYLFMHIAWTKTFTFEGMRRLGSWRVVDGKNLLKMLWHVIMGWDLLIVLRWCCLSLNPSVFSPALDPVMLCYKYVAIPTAHSQHTSTVKLMEAREMETWQLEHDREWYLRFYIYSIAMFTVT